MLANLVDILPTWLIDDVIPLVLPGSSLTVPIAGHSWFHPFDKPIRPSIPLGPFNVPLPVTFEVEDIAVADLNKFTALKPLKLLDSSRFTWAGSIASQEMAITLPLKLSVLGYKIGVTVKMDVSQIAIDYTAIIAFNRTRTCEVWGKVMQSSATCAVWPMSHHESAGVSGLNITDLRVNVTDFTFGMDVTGIGPLNTYLQEFLTAFLQKEKPNIISNLPGKLSVAIRNMANLGALHGLPAFQEKYPCISPTVAGQNATDVSRICISNNGGYALKWKSHNCPAHLTSEYTPAYAIDQSKCMDMKTVFPDVVEGQILRAGTLAIAGLHEIIDPPMRYVPDSNVAGFECSGTTLTMNCKLVSVAPVDPSTLPEVERVCIMNHAGFVMYYEVQNSKSHQAVATSSRYPIDVMKCTDLSATSGVKDGDILQMNVHAIAGKTEGADRMVQFKKNNMAATFECTGTTLDYSCKLMVARIETASQTQNLGSEIVVI